MIKYLTLLLFSLTYLDSFSQINSGLTFNKLDDNKIEYMQGFGLSMKIRAIDFKQNLPNGDLIQMGGLTYLYNGRVNYPIMEDLSVSLNAYPDVGFSFIDGVGLGMDFPLLAQLNIGRYSSYEDESPIGGQFGFGYGLGFNLTTNFGNGFGANLYHGYIAMAGLNINMGMRSMGILLKFQHTEQINNLYSLMFVFNGG